MSWMASTSPFAELITTKQEMKEGKPMTPSRGQPRQPGVPCFKGATRQKGCKNLTLSPTTSWPLS